MEQEIPDIFKNISPAAGIESVDLQKQADAVIQSLTHTYLENARLQLSDMKRYIQEARLLSGSNQMALVHGELFRVAHDMKGQGTTFGYPLLTAIGSIICDKIRPLTQVNTGILDEFEQLAGMAETVMQFPPHAQNDILVGIEKRVVRLREVLNGK